MPEAIWIWLVGLSFALLCVGVGVGVRFFERHEWLAGYNTAPPEERARYDVRGLAHHVGNGLITLGALLALATASFVHEATGWTWTFIGLFLFVVFLIVAGGQKFRPGHRHDEGERPPAEHPFLRWLLPERAFRAVETGTRHWLIECPCGSRLDFWDAGGVRWKAAGEPRQLFPCRACGQTRWNKVRRKAPGELGGPGRAPCN